MITRKITTLGIRSRFKSNNDLTADQSAGLESNSAFDVFNKIHYDDLFEIDGELKCLIAILRNSKTIQEN